MLKFALILLTTLLPQDLSDSLVRVCCYREAGIPVGYVDDEDTVRVQSNTPDSVIVARLNALNTAFPLSYNEIVRGYCIRYSEKMPAAMAQAMGRARHYWPIFDEIFTCYDIPLEMKHLVIVESMLKPKSTSKSGAKGLWQFMYRTGIGYGLRINTWVDERMDPVASTVAAAKYLRDAYAAFGDWALALCSYNCGAGSVRKAIARCGGKTDFWMIYEFLPKETRSYLPAFIGALYAASYHKEYGIVPSEDVIPVVADTLHISRNLHFDQIAAYTGTSVNVLRELNPQYIHDMIPGDSGKWVLRLPVEKSCKFIEAGDTVYQYKADSLFNKVRLENIKNGATYSGNRVVYTVRKGDVLGKIAVRFGCSVSQLKKWNSMKSDNIRIGQKLVIYVR